MHIPDLHSVKRNYSYMSRHIMRAIHHGTIYSYMSWYYMRLSMCHFVNSIM